MELPLSATLRYVPVSPVTVNAAVRKQALTVPLPAPIYWHSLHQQTRVTIGGAELSQRTAPQRHRPVIVIASSSQRGQAFDRRCYVGDYMAGKLRSHPPGPPLPS